MFKAVSLLDLSVTMNYYIIKNKATKNLSDKAASVVKILRCAQDDRWGRFVKKIPLLCISDASQSLNLLGHHLTAFGMTNT